MARLALTTREKLRVALILALILVAIAALRWRQDILETLLDPKVPFQTYKPPLAPDYARGQSWALIPADAATPSPADPSADVFFVHATTYDGGRDWNGPIDDPRASDFLTHVILPNYAGPFVHAGRLFAPRYRQASVYTELTMREDAQDARAFAYGDVRRAFDFYLDHFNQGRPLVVVGVEQGGTMVERLMAEEVAQRPDLVRRIAAVYLIDAVALADDYAPKSPLPACKSREQPRCVVGWSQAFAFDQANVRKILERSLVWAPNDELVTVKGRPILCVNPLLGAQSDALADAKLNLGAAAASDVDWGTRPALLTRQVSAQCVDGVLRVSAPQSPSLKEQGGWLDRLKEPGFNLFYGDLEADAEARVQALARASPPR
jgi:hypothetical protein